jgi:electron transfer flavoprotein alpha subunit
MAVLVIAEHDNASVKDATNKVVTAAKAMGGDVDVLVAGSNAGGAAAAAAKIDGVRKVLHADGATLAKQMAEPLEALIVPLAANYDAILFPASTTGKNAAPRVAAKLDVMQVSGVIGVEGADTFVRPIYAGNAIITVKDEQSKHVLVVQPTAFKAAGNSGSASVETTAAPAGPFKSAFVSEEMAKSDRPELTAAKRIVSGGRALGSSEEFHKVLEPLADKLGAAVGASRAAVDAGYAPNDYQVGQTGKVVAPELYVAIGISGAIQHLAGMKDSKVIVAINKDEDAPIFQVADYGLVADYKTAVPELMEELGKAGV